ncbi:hypothetical protein H9653_03515 [Psychrobacter sp. Sa4CVA2]|uniref:Uncharacterized protein n=2 Tax=Moraxellaceae TaxID=468 RepID=A0ABR8RH60_9GAMM|nr:hypothetical protein [Psychrobacter communis]
MMTNNKTPDDKSSAENVEQHLGQLEKTEVTREQLSYSQEQPFSSDELRMLINEERLNELLADSDAFLVSLSGEIEDFEDKNKDP